MQERSRNVKTILQGRFRRCIMGIYGKAEESPRSSPRAQRRQEGWEGPVEGCPSGRASETRTQGCPRAVEEKEEVGGYLLNKNLIKRLMKV